MCHPAGKKPLIPQRLFYSMIARILHFLGRYVPKLSLSCEIHRLG
jgi:hypothetical protein